MEGTSDVDRTSAALTKFQAPMAEIALRTGTIELRAFEILDAERIAADLCPAVCALLRDARAVLSEIQDACDDIGVDFEPEEKGRSIRSSYLQFERAIDETKPTTVRSHRTVEEIAFMALLELRQREERLGRVRAEHGATALLGECDSSLRRIRKALCAVDAAIANRERVAPLLVFRSETDVSLAVRRAYAKFRTRLLTPDQPTLESIHARFRSAGTQIAMLVGWNVYREMRVRDRLVLRDLQQRILQWLRGEGSESPADGLRLWQDLAACVEMFSLVNRRQELVEHDGAVVRRALALLRLSPEGAEAAIWAEIESLEGLDRELDELLAARPRPSAHRAIDALERLAAHFGPVPGPDQGSSC